MRYDVRWFDAWVVGKEDEEMEMRWKITFMLNDKRNQEIREMNFLFARRWMSKWKVIDDMSITSSTFYEAK